MNLHRLDLVSLQLFVHVARAGSISGGAQRAHLAVGAASKRITDLEDALGSTLFERHSRGVAPTPAGQALLAHALKLLSDIDHLAADLSDHARGISGVVRMWANTAAITQFLPASIAAFLRENPGIRIGLEEGNSADVLLAVLDGRADVGICAEGVPTLGLQTRPFRRDRLVLVVPSDHALAARRSADFVDAADFDFVGLSAGTSIAARQELAAQALGRRLRVRIHVRSFDAMCRMVAAGLGIAVLPDLAVRPHLKSMGLRRIALRDDWADRSLLLAARDFAALARPARLLIDHLRQAGEGQAGKP